MNAKSKAFGEHLRGLRQAKKVTLKQIAERTFIDISYISRLEKGVLVSIPTRETIDKISKALICTEQEYNALLAKAGRIDTDLEKYALIAQARPELKTLFGLATSLTAGQINQLISTIEHYE